MTLFVFNMFQTNTKITPVVDLAILAADSDLFLRFVEMFHDIVNSISNSLLNFRNTNF